MVNQINRLPDALQKKLPVIREAADPRFQALVTAGMLRPGTKHFRMGKALIFLSPPTGEMGWHMSISRPDRYPDWDEVVGAWYRLVPDAANREGVMHLPPLSAYVNIHEYCFQVHELMEGGK